jgi:hypothetical protein
VTIRCPHAWVFGFVLTAGSLTLPACAEPQEGAPDLATARRLDEMAAKSVLRVEGTFGEFTGHVSRIDASGLTGLRPDSRLDPGSALPTEPLAWSQVTRVERLGTKSRRYANIGAVLGGVVVGSLTATIAAVFGEDGGSRKLIGGFVFGAFPGALVGGGAGALIGMRASRWELVYGQPRPR